MSDDAESGGDYDLGGYDSDGSLESDLGDNGFFELEAAESGAESDGDDNTSSNHWQPSPSPPPLESFPQFLRLPVELRHHVWSSFCPDLVAKSRVFEFVGFDVSASTSRYVEEGTFLRQQTEAIRAVLATHRESRAFALRALPDTLPFCGGTSVVRFNKDRDVVILNTRGADSAPSDFLTFAEKITHLAVWSGSWPYLALANPSYEHSASYDFVRRLLLKCPNVEAVYLLFDHSQSSLNSSDLSWLTANNIRYYHFQTIEEEYGLGEDLDFAFCWPDPSGDYIPTPIVAEPPEWATLSQTSSHGSYDSDSASGDQSTGLRRIPLFPMIQFDLESGMEKFDRLMDCRRSGKEMDWYMYTSSQSDSETNEYESEGIDDDEGDTESHQSSEEEDDLAVLSRSEDESGGQDSVSEQDSIASSDRFLDEAGDGHPGNEYPAANFSSPEAGPGSNPAMDSASSPTLDGSDESPVRIVKRPKRRITSSDTDDGSENGPLTEPERPSKRIRVVLSDSEDD